MDFKYYRVTVKHDTGRVNICLSASDESTASRLVQAAEACPSRAILKVKEITKRQFINLTKS